MIRKLTFAAALLAATVLSGVASAKTFVYCSEGSPEGFDPGLYTAGTTFDASSRTVYNRLVEFKQGTTEIEPGLAESWEISDDGLEYTFKLRPGVKFQTTDFFTPTRDLNADDVIFSFERQCKADNPWNQYVAGTCLGILHRHGHARPDQVDREGRRPDGQVHAQRSRKRRSSPTSAWTSPRSSRRNMPTSSRPTARWNS